jgi:archaemetzincin
MLQVIRLIPVGEVEKSLLETLRQSLVKVFNQSTQLDEGILLPQESWDSHRKQHLASMLLDGLPQPHGGERVLGIVDADIFAPRLNFVFGQADMINRKALISLVRLRPEFYNLPPDDALFRERAVKEAVHELGHTHGLGHCPDPVCVMHFSNSLQDTDIKSLELCPLCQRKINQSIVRERAK